MYLGKISSKKKKCI